MEKEEDSTSEYYSTGSTECNDDEFSYQRYECDDDSSNSCQSNSIPSCSQTHSSQTDSMEIEENESSSVADNEFGSGEEEKDENQFEEEGEDNEDKDNEEEEEESEQSQRQQAARSQIPLTTSNSQRASQVPTSQPAEKIAFVRCKKFKPELVHSFSALQGVKNLGELRPDSDPVSYFSLLITDEFLEQVCGYSNQYRLIHLNARQIGRRKGANKSHEKKWQDITLNEIKAFFGLLLLFGINTLPEIEHYWQDSRLFGN